MSKTDLKKELATLYSTGKKDLVPHLVEVPPLQYVMIDGTGDPNSESFGEAMGALYAAAYGVKFASKADGRDFGVMGAEGLWWTDPPEAFSMTAKGDWFWTLLLILPEWITSGMVDDALAAAVEKGKVDQSTAAKVRLETLNEGLSVQVLHIGPYEAEPPTIASMHEYAYGQGYKLRGKHHEIYMNDPRRVAPEKMKTILRHPIEPV